MVNKHLLADRVHDKIANESFNLLTSSIFINALPVGDEVKIAYKKPLFESATKFITACGSSKLIDKALENTSNPIANTLTRVYGDVVFTTAKEASDRVMHSDLANIEPTLQSAVDKVAMTAEELDRFKAKADKISMNEIADNIKKKTIDVIKDERDMYEKEEELKNELQEALDASESYKGVTAMEYAKMTSDFSLNHETFFSRLQEMAFESLIYKVPYDDKAIFATVDRIANECGVLVDGFKATKNTFNAALEEINSYHSAVNEEIALSPEDRHKCMDDAMFAAMVVYCMYETLSKLNFIKIDRHALKEFIEVRRTMDPHSVCKGDVDTVKGAVKTLVYDTTKDIRKDVVRSTVVDRIDKLNEAKEALAPTNAMGFVAVENDVFVDEINMIENAIATLEAAIAVDAPQTPESLSTRANAEAYKEKCRQQSAQANVIKCDRINKMFARFPEITDILLRIDPNQNFEKNIVIDAQGKALNGELVQRTQVVLEPDYTRPPVELVKLAVESSALTDTKQWNITLKLDNGYGEKILIH